MFLRIFIISGIIGISSSVYSQRYVPQNLPGFDREFLHLGYYAGFNSMNFIVKSNEGFQISTKAGPGISVGLASSFRISKYLDIKFLPGLNFGYRELLIRDTANIYTKMPDWSARIESVYIDFPVHLKYRSKRDNNFAPYLLGGFAPKIDIFGRQLLRDKDVIRLLRHFDFSPEIGVGIDFYLYKVKMSTELKFSVGQLNIYMPVIEDEAYKLFNNSIRSLKSKKVSLTFHFLGK